MDVSDLNPNARPFDFSGSPSDSSPEAFPSIDLAAAEGAGRWPSDLGRHVGPFAQSAPPNARAPLARRPSKKEVAAAARRRRHSVDAIDFAGLRACNVHTFLRHIRLHKYSDLLCLLSFEELLAVDDAGLERLGMHAKGARTRLLKAIDRYNEHLAEAAEAALRYGSAPYYGTSLPPHLVGRQGGQRAQASHGRHHQNHHHHARQHQGRSITVPPGGHPTRADGSAGYGRSQPVSVPQPRGGSGPMYHHQARFDTQPAARRPRYDDRGPGAAGAAPHPRRLQYQGADTVMGHADRYPPQMRRDGDLWRTQSAVALGSGQHRYGVASDGEYEDDDVGVSAVVEHLLGFAFDSDEDEDDYDDDGEDEYFHGYGRGLPSLQPQPQPRSAADSFLAAQGRWSAGPAVPPNNSVAAPGARYYQPQNSTALGGRAWASTTGWGLGGNHSQAAAAAAAGKLRPASPWDSSRDKVAVRAQ